MSSFIIEGGHPLSGSIKPQGAKNEALEVISAVLLTEEKVTISNIPDILDVKNLLDLFASMGVKVTRLEKGTYSFQADSLDRQFIFSEDFVRKCSRLRGSVMVAGPLLARFGEVYFPKPGGDKIGRRRVDTHIAGLMNLGAQLAYDEKLRAFHLSLPAGKRLEGKYMLLDEASVTGTANILMAASLASGKTTIYNAACEPYIQQLCRLLVGMGADIEGIGSNLLTVHGVDRLHGASHKILPDMIEVGSFIGMAAITRSEITIKDTSYSNLGIIPESFRRIGVKLEQHGDDILVPRQDSYEIESFMDGSIMTIADAPWPGLTPDLLSVFLVVATQCKEIILCDPHRAVVIGHDHNFRLRAGNMLSPDIRAGIALLLAAMSAKGTSVIGNIEQIDRGYEDIDGRLNALGASITRNI